MKDWRWEGIWYVSGVGGRLVGLEFGDGGGVIWVVVGGEDFGVGIVGFKIKLVRVLGFFGFLCYLIFSWMDFLGLAGMRRGGNREDFGIR